MSNLLRPRVFVNESIQELITPGANPLVVGLIGVSEQGTENIFQLFDNIADVETEYGTNLSNGANLVAMARLAFAEGATQVKLCSIGTPTVADTDALTVAAQPGDEQVTIASNTGYAIGEVIYIGSGNAGFEFEERRVITGVSGSTIIQFTGDPLQFAHSTTESVHEVTEPVAGDFTTALGKLELDRDIQAVAIQSDNDTINANLLTAVNNAYANQNFMVALRGCQRGTTESSAVSKATAHNDDFMILVFPTLLDKNGKYLDGYMGAAAMAGAVAGRGVPGVNFNLLELESFAGVEVEISNIDTLIAGGVTPIELRDNVIRGVRLMTTSLTINGQPSDLLEEGSVRFNVNRIQRTVQRALEQRFLTAGNTPSTREQIRSTVKNILRDFAIQEILVTDEATGTPGFKDPLVRTDSNNRKQVNVEIEIAPTLPLVFIQLNFRINL